MEYGGSSPPTGWRFNGQALKPTDLELIREVVRDFAGLSRMELAHTVCELLGWRRESGRLKGRDCRELLERLEAEGVIELPEKRARRPVGSRTRVPVTAAGEPGPELCGEVGEYSPIVLERVSRPDQRLLFRELVGRHHYLGHAVPFGAHLRYLVYASRPTKQVVGCVQFSSPAWRMAVRDDWIGWDEGTRRRNLQRVINNSRFLILPWVRVRNLASVILSLALRRVAAEWVELYAVEPMLVETLVDSRRYGGHCYRAANFQLLGETTGRGRMDRHTLRKGEAPKTVWVYPLVRDAVHRLRES
jgi:Druantia protein DruA